MNELLGLGFQSNSTFRPVCCQWDKEGHSEFLELRYNIGVVNSTYAINLARSSIVLMFDNRSYNISGFWDCSR
jgi:hypothetical protein